MTDIKDTMICQRVLRNTASNYGSKLIALLTGFLLTPFILHQLGVAAYGLWVLVGSVMAYGSLINFNIGSAVIKFLAEQRARGESEGANNLLATALCLYCFLGVVAVGLTAAIAPLFPYIFNIPPIEHTPAIWLALLMGLGIGLSIPCSMPNVILWSLQRFDITNILSIIGTTLSTLATVAILLLGGGVLGMVVVNIVIMLVMSGAAIWCIRGIAPDLHLGWRSAKRPLVRKIMSFSSWVFIMDVAYRVQTKTAEILIAAFLPVSAVTPYAIVRRLSEMAQILTDQFMKVLFPLASELDAESDRRRLRSLYITGTRLTLAIFLPLGGVLIIFARPILTMWVGVDYADYSYLVLILTFSSLIDTSQWPAGAVLQGIARHRPLALIMVGMALANLALSIALVQRFGLTGVALGTLIITVAGNLGFVMPYTMRVLDVSATEVLVDIIRPALLPVIPMAIMLYLLQEVFEPNSLLVIVGLGGIGVLVYIVGYLSMGAAQVERQVYRSLVFNTFRLAQARLKRL